MNEPSVEGRVPEEDAEALMVPPDDEGMPTPRAVEQVTDAEDLPSDTIPPDDA